MAGTPGGGSHACLVAIDTPGGPWLCEVPLVPGMCVAHALAAARVQARAAAGPAALERVDWESGRVGIWNQRCTRDRLLAPGDRVELYLPLPGDPRERRRARAGPTRGPLRRPGR